MLHDAELAEFLHLNTWNLFIEKQNVMKINRLKFILALLLLAICGASSAKEVTPDVALKVATNFMRQKSSEKLVFENVAKHIGFTNFYIFNATNAKSFVIVAADDIIQPILAYSEKNSFNTENMPSNIRAWLWGYEKEIQWAKENNCEATEETANDWKTLLEGGRLKSRSDKSVNALLTTTWNQSPLYNMLCPSNSYTGQNAVTGCVATAMAQIMKYWNHPISGRSFHSYNSSFGTLSVNFSNTTYDWNNMPNELNGTSSLAQRNAVATLMYHCGVSVDMQYGLGASGAYSQDVPYALKTYFKYDSLTRFVNKIGYSDSDWKTKLKNELDAGRPIFYAGNSTGSGHAFVCDGYDNSNNFHFNWGWGGLCDGYYSLNNLAPSSGGTGAGNRNYTTNQYAVIGIQPSTASTHSMKMYDNLTINNTIYRYGSNITGYIRVVNNGNAPFTGYVAVALFHAQNILVKMQCFPVSGLLCNSSTTHVINIPGGTPLIPGPYIAYAMCSTDSVNWDIVNSSTNANNVTSFSVYYGAEIETYSSFSSINFVQGEPATVNINFLNAGASTFNGKVRVVLANPTNDSVVQAIDTLDLTAGLSAGSHLSNGANFSTSAITAAPGTYLMILEYQSSGNTSWNLAGSTYYTNPIFATIVGPPTLSISQPSLNFPNSGGNETVEVTSNVNWRVSTYPFWLTVTPPAGCESGEFVVTATPNTGSARTATITVSGDNGVSSHTITINQAGGYGISEAETDGLFLQVWQKQIIIDGIRSERVLVCDMLGRTVYNAVVNEKAEIAVSNSGVYLIKAGSRPARKVVVTR